MSSYNVIKPFEKSLLFEDFYNLMKKIHPLNLDMWFFIYNLSLPKFKENEVCLMKSSFDDKFREIKIVYTYYHCKLNSYIYSYIRDPFYFQYAIEEVLKNKN